jgi:hypothetical protein
MTDAYDRLRVRKADRIGNVVVVAASLTLGLLAIGARTYRTFTGGGADMAHHYQLVSWYNHHWTPPRAMDMARYPPGAHILAAEVGRLVGSPFRGMQLVAITGIVVIWSAIAALLTFLPGRRRWVAVGALALVLALDTSAGPLRLDVHGFEIVLNFFFAEAVAQGVVWWSVWFAVHRRLAVRSPISTAVPLAIAAVLLTFVHLLPAVELLVLVGCLCAAELVQRWETERRSARSLGVPIVLAGSTAVALVLTPGFRTMRELAANNGSLDVPYLSGLAGYIGVAVAVAVVSFVLLVAAGRRDEAATGAVLQGLGFVGFAVALPCVLQAVALAAGEGSAYAVKKYIFGLSTVLVVDACVAAAVFVPAAVIGVTQRAAVRFAAAVALVVVAMLSVFSHRGSGYSMSAVTTLERHVVDVAHAAQAGTGGRGYAVGLPRADPVIDYMFTRTEFAAPLDRTTYSILVGRPDLRFGEAVTGVGSPYDLPICRTFGPREGLVVVDIGCRVRMTNRCHSVNVLGQRGLVADPRLSGFSSAEPAGRWTDGESASFSCVFAGSPPKKPVTIAVDGTAFLPPGVQRQRVTLAASGTRKHFVLTPEEPHTVLLIVVPPSSSRRLTLRMRLPDAVSPHTLGLSIDSRRLGLFVNEIRIS